MRKTNNQFVLPLYFAHLLLTPSRWLSPSSFLTAGSPPPLFSFHSRQPTLLFPQQTALHLCCFYSRQPPLCCFHSRQPPYPPRADCLPPSPQQQIALPLCSFQIRQPSTSAPSRSDSPPLLLLPDQTVLSLCSVQVRPLLLPQQTTPLPSYSRQLSPSATNL